MTSEVFNAALLHSGFFSRPETSAVAARDFEPPPPVAPRVPSALPRLVAFTGKTGAGKSTAAKALVERFGYVRIGFADPLKAMLGAFLAHVGVHPETVQSMLHGVLKNAPTGYLGGNSARHAMQTLGTEWGRRCMGVDFWIEALAHRLGYAPKQKFVIDDLRFDNEAEFVRAKGGWVIEVRAAAPPSPTPAHASERGIDRNLIDKIVMNYGDEFFGPQVCRIARDLGARQ